MASARFSEQALRQMAAHDAWRVQAGWDPIALEIYNAVLACFARWNPEVEPYYLPGKRAKLRGQPTDIRVVPVTVRSKPFMVYYRFAQGVFQIRRVRHPRAR